MLSSLFRAGLVASALLASQIGTAITAHADAQEANLNQTLQKYSGKPQYDWLSEIPSSGKELSSSALKTMDELRKGEGYTRNDPRFSTKYFWDEEQRMVTGFCEWTDKVEGPPGAVHGGCLSAVMDELLGHTVFADVESPAVTANLSVNFRKFVPLGSIMKLEAQVEKREGRKIFVIGRITDGKGVVHVDASGLFLEIGQWPSDKPKPNK
mmetsp:Transcript_2806/g.3726  ORF Transcript_2806/g.3726 Transcript_2806/m.3726 type:complete len:210 (-) Transcript_2806:359-988(-)